MVIHTDHIDKKFIEINKFAEINKDFAGKLIESVLHDDPGAFKNTYNNALGDKYFAGNSNLILGFQLELFDFAARNDCPKTAEMLLKELVEEISTRF